MAAGVADKSNAFTKVGALMLDAAIEELNSLWFPGRKLWEPVLDLQPPAGLFHRLIWLILLRIMC
jgi:hypothetical protein